MRSPVKLYIQLLNFVKPCAGQYFLTLRAAVDIIITIIKRLLSIEGNASDALSAALKGAVKRGIYEGKNV